MPLSSTEGGAMGIPRSILYDVEKSLSPSPRVPDGCRVFTDAGPRVLR